MVVYQTNLAIAQLLTNIAIAAIENAMLAVDFPSGMVIFLTHGSLPDKSGYFTAIS